MSEQHLQEPTSEFAMPEVVLCECGHPLRDHAWSGWGRHTVCVVEVGEGPHSWHGVCPCVRTGGDGA